jgi:hypothetical protein
MLLTNKWSTECAWKLNQNFQTFQTELVTFQLVTFHDKLANYYNLLESMIKERIKFSQSKKISSHSSKSIGKLVEKEQLLSLTPQKKKKIINLLLILLPFYQRSLDTQSIMSILGQIPMAPVFK